MSATFGDAFKATIDRGVWIASNEFPDQGDWTRIRYLPRHGTWETQTAGDDGVWRNDSTYFDAWPWPVNAPCVHASWTIQEEHV